MSEDLYLLLYVMTVFGGLFTLALFTIWPVILFAMRVEAAWHGHTTPTVWTMWKASWNGELDELLRTWEG